MGRKELRFNHKRVSLFGVLALIAFAYGQQGPEVPCVGCPVFTNFAFPETGIWYNPEQSGTGFMFEVQNGWLGGFYYLYEEEGRPVWYLIAGALEPLEEEGVTWLLHTQLERLEDGACLNCPFQPPVVVEPAGQIRLEFPNRNLGRFSVDDGPVQNIVPLTYGVDGQQLFHPLTDYVFPDLEGDWIFAIMGDETWDILGIEMAKNENEGIGGGRAVYELLRIRRVGDAILTPPPPREKGSMECFGDQTSGPICIIEIQGTQQGLLDLSFAMHLADLGDARFVAETEDGILLEAFRLDYD